MLSTYWVPEVALTPSHVLSQFIPTTPVWQGRMTYLSDKETQVKEGLQESLLANHQALEAKRAFGITNSAYRTHSPFVNTISYSFIP